MLFIIAFLLQGVFSVQFTFSLKQKELKCFGENIGQNSLVVGAIQGNSSEYSLKIHMPTKKVDNILQYTHSQELHKFSFTTNNTQLNYQFCIHNLANDWTSYNFTLVTGMDAQDFSLLAQKEDLKPLEIHLKKLNGLVNAVELDQKRQKRDNRIGSKMFLKYHIKQSYSAQQPYY